MQRPFSSIEFPVASQVHKILEFEGSASAINILKSRKMVYLRHGKVSTRKAPGMEATANCSVALSTMSMNGSLWSWIG